MKNPALVEERWQRALRLLGARSGEASAELKRRVEPTRVVYAFDATTPLTAHVDLVLMQQKRGPDGEWLRPKPERLTRDLLNVLSDEDRSVVALLIEPRRSFEEDYSAFDFTLHRSIAAQVVKPACLTGQAVLRVADGASQTLVAARWDDGAPLRLRVSVRRDGEAFVVAGALVRKGEAIPLTAVVSLCAVGLVFGRDGRVARLEDGELRWAEALLGGELRIPEQGVGELLRALHGPSRPAELDLPKELTIVEERVTPLPRLTIEHQRAASWLPVKPLGVVRFAYAEALARENDTSRTVPHPAEPRRHFVRDLPREAAALAQLKAAGFISAGTSAAGDLLYEHVGSQGIAKAIHALVQLGWRVEAQGQRYRKAGELELSVGTGIDWFELSGEARFDGAVLALPKLLQALGRGDATVVLDDGTLGVLPEEWLEKYAKLAQLGEAAGDALRFDKRQLSVLDAMLEGLPTVHADALFVKARKSLGAFTRVKPKSPPKGFTGALRDYQREGLGWFSFLRDIDFGGCLADDMGLGKTVQVLALLLERKLATKAKRGATAEARRPSLVVVPRSVLSNWRLEAERFTPSLSVVEHVGPSRATSVAGLIDTDVVLTTYGTLRRDITWLAELELDYAVLDEAQAIKNATTANAKAARLLKARHRLALSGTPIENHLGELWSLFEFLSPGLLGTKGFAELLDADARAPSREVRELVVRTVRPFILRRTKEQVARELPPKQEQVVHCELGEAQRLAYDELATHYRAALGARLEEGVGKAKMDVLEALLRLRQAACHPGLLDEARAGEPSAKLDVLLPRLREVAEGGHKALVFSQFTSFLALVRRELDVAGLEHAYLDGRTRDRDAPIKAFQEDPDCKVFVISLKAGGVGLNLTAADYVFILDPWWNPAVEAQAIGRAHRIGQEKPVFAYRLVAKDTVEERILELQAQKQDLVESIMEASGASLKSLSKEDLLRLFA